MPFGMEKLEWWGYPTVKKLWRYVYAFWQNVRTWDTDRHRMTAKAAQQKQVIQVRKWYGGSYTTEFNRLQHWSIQCSANTEIY